MQNISASLFTAITVLVIAWASLTASLFSCWIAQRRHTRDMAALRAYRARLEAR